MIDIKFRTTVIYVVRTIVRTLDSMRKTTYNEKVHPAQKLHGKSIKLSYNNKKSILLGRL